VADDLLQRLRQAVVDAFRGRLVGGDDGIEEADGVAHGNSEPGRRLPRNRGRS
jgi:hypothetical protein